MSSLTTIAAPAAYSHEHLCKATRRQPAAVQGWIGRDYFAADFQTGTGRGQRRLYTGRHILQIGIAAHLADHGAQFDHAYELAAVVMEYGATFAPDPDHPGEFADDFDFFVGMHQAEDGYHLATERKAYRTYRQCAQAIPADAVDVVLILNVGRIAHNIRTYLESIST